MNATQSSGTVAVPVLHVFLVLELCAYRMTMRVGPIVEPCIVIFFALCQEPQKKKRRQLPLGFAATVRCDMCSQSRITDGWCNLSLYFFYIITVLCHPLHSLACQASHGPIKARMLGQIHPLDVTAFDAVFVFECEPVSRWRNAECDRHIINVDGWLL